MKLETLTLNNFQSYDNETVEFEDGISVLYGENGAGKSTILRGIFASLFQTSMKSELSGDINIGGLVNKNEENGSVTLVFTHNNETYTVNWEIAVTEENDGDRRGRTKSCTLTNESGSISLSNVTEVSEYITDLLGLDAQAFVNSVYVQQEELTKLLTADTETRKEIFDRLLGLQQIDQYIDRMDKARREVKSVRKEQNSRKSELQSQLDDYPSESSLHQDRQKLQKKVSSVERDIDELQNKRDELTATKAKLEATDEDYDELIQKRDELADEVSDRQNTIGKLNKQVSDLQDERDTLQQSLQNTPTGDVNELQEKIAKTREKRDSVKDESSDVQATVRTKQNELRQTAQNLRSVTADLAEKKQEREVVRVELEQKRQKLQELSKKQNDLLVELETNITPTIDAIDDKIETLQDQKANLDARINSYESSLTELDSERATKKERINQLEQQLETLQSELDLPEVFNETTVDSLTVEEVEQEVTSAENIQTDTLTPEKAYNLLVDTLPTLQRETEDTKNIEFLRTATLYYTLVYEQEETKAEIENLRGTLQTLRSELDGLKQEKQSNKTLLHAYQNDYESINNELTKLKTLRDLVEEEHSVEFSSLVEDFNNADVAVEKLDDKQDALSENLSDLLAKTQTEAQRSADLSTEIEDLDDKLSSLEEEMQALQSAQQSRNRLETIESKIENKRDMLDNKVSQISQLKNNKTKVEDTLNELNAFDMTLEEVNDELDTIEQSLDKKNDARDKHKSEISTVRDKIDAIESLHDRIESIESRTTELTQQLAQVKELKQSYTAVKEETRKQYISKINQYTNEIFTAIYQNKSYESVYIDTEYNITLRRTDGTTIEPSLTSGGESAIVNLALRAGVYRVITEAGNTSLPPFILDEPTTFLDTQHVGKLEQLARTMADWDIKQVFIVSHNEQLIESGDAVYNVRKGDDSSYVEKEF